MPGRRIAIVCRVCGADTLLRREPVFDGFKKTGERLSCAACGHVYAAEADVPFKEQAGPSIFTEDDKPRAPDVFRDDDKARNCRHCRHYVVNPFTQRCGLHEREVQATDACGDFEPRE